MICKIKIILLKADDIFINHINYRYLIKCQQHNSRITFINPNPNLSQKIGKANRIQDIGRKKAKGP